MGALVPMGIGMAGAGRGEGVIRSARIAGAEAKDRLETGREEAAGLRDIALGAWGAVFLGAALARGAAFLGLAFLAAFAVVFRVVFLAVVRGAFRAPALRAPLAAAFFRFGGIAPVGGIENDTIARLERRD